MGATLPLLLNVSVALAVAAACGMLAGAVRLSPIVGYLLAGILVGPFTPGFVADRGQIAILADIGVVFLMFALGVAFSLRELVRIGSVAVGGSLIQIFVTVVGGWFIASWFGWTGIEGLYFGAILAASSSMVILKTLIDRGEVASSHGRLLLSMSIVQDLVVVLMVVTLPAIANPEAPADPLLLLRDAAVTLAKAAVFIAICVFGGLKVAPPLFAYLGRHGVAEHFTAAAAVLALGLSAASALLGLSAALGAFLAGLMLSESEYDQRLTSEVAPIRDLLVVLFFVFIGMMIDVKFLVAHWPTVLGVAVITLGLKVLATAAGLIPYRVAPRTLAFTSFAMIPVGELNYLLAHTGMEIGAVSEVLYNTVLAASLVTILLTPAAFAIAEPVAAWLAGWRLLRDRTQPNGAGDDRDQRFSSHAVVVGYGRVGHTVAGGLKSMGMPVTIVDSRMDLIQEARADGLAAVHGDASLVTTLTAANVEAARLVVVALPSHPTARSAVRLSRDLNPRCSIIARAQRLVHKGELESAGADEVLVPEVAGAEAVLRTVVERLATPT